MKSRHIIFLCLIAFLETTNCLVPFTLEEFVNGEFVNKQFDGLWVGGNKFLYKNKTDYKIHEIGKKTEDTFLEGKLLNNYKNVSKVLPSQDLLYALVEYEVLPVYRHTKTAKYALYKKGSKTFVNLASQERLQLCKWVGNKSLIYVQNNNIFYIKDVTDVTIVKSQLTQDGMPGVIYNGIPDWVYEEEVLASDSAIWISPNSKALVFARFDDKNVGDFPYVKYGEPSPLKPYPEVLTLKYPKVGTTNPTVKLFYYDFTKSTPPKVVEATTNTELIMYGVTWNVTEFFVVYKNRIQDEGMLRKCKETTCSTLETYSTSAGWLDVSLPVFSKNGSSMAQIRPSKGFQQLWFKASEKALNEVVAQANKTVVSIYGVDGQIIYYSATLLGQYSQLHIYSYDHNKKKETCLSCDYVTPDGKCKYATASFSTDLSRYAQTCQGNYPNYVTLEDVKNGAPEIWERNDDVRKKLKGKSLPQVEDRMLSMSGYEIAVRLLLPPNIDKKKKYPMIVNVYAGPNSNQITDKFSVGYEKYIVTNMSYIYAYIDGRGSGLRGNELAHKVHKKLGTVEIEDQILATKNLQSLYPYIDKDRTCIWGWSYGGFATAWALVKDTGNVFKCGISVAPVTNFLLYDSIYTERYMGKETNAGYKDADLTKQAALFKNKNFFLIHGNADDNVHYQQSMLLARALELSDVHFQQMSYPEENHRINGASLHLYHEITKFFRDNLAPDVKKNGVYMGKSSLMGICFCVLLSTANYFR